MKSYAQYGEDLILCELLKDLPLKKQHYVDIGAYHPWKMSNTALFYKNGWRGLIIDPSPNMLQFKDERPSDTVIQCCCGSYDGETDMFYHNSWSTASLLNTWDINNKFTTKVKIYKLSTLLTNYYYKYINDISLCSIDTEGTEKDILLGIDWTTFKPMVFIVESYQRGTGKPIYLEWEPILLNNGYKYYTCDIHKLNRIYVNEICSN